MSAWRRRIPRPLTLAQILSSAAGAVPMLIAAVRMEPTVFTAFAVITLAGSLAVGGSRAAVFQPALIHQRNDPASLVPARYMLVVASLSAIVVAAIAFFAAGADALSSAVMGVASAIPVVYDWARYRAIGTTRRWAVAQGDGVRLLLVLATALPIVAADSVVFVLVIGISCAVAAVVVLVQVPLRIDPYPYRRYRASAAWQTLDFAVGQFVVSVPLIALAGTGADRLVGGVRLAQTLLGPLNLAFSAASANIVADGSTHEDYKHASAVIRRGWRASARLVVFAGAIVGVLALGVWLTGFSLRGVDQSDLLLGILLVGGSTILTGWSGIHGIVLRVLDHQSAVTLVRIGIAVLTIAGFVGGFLLGGDRLSLILGFAANAVAAPALFLPVALHYYRRHAAEDPGPDGPSAE